jgi:transposase
MAKSYSRDLRERMVRAVLASRSRHEAARIFHVSASCLIKLMQRYAAIGDCHARKLSGRERHALSEHEDKLRAMADEQPDLTITSFGESSPRPASKRDGGPSAPFCNTCD